MFGGNPQRTAWARGTGRLSATPSVRWTYDLGGDVAQPAVALVDVNGDRVEEIVYVVGGKLVARDLRDRVLWDSIPVGLDTIVGVADLTGDGRAEIVATRQGPAGVFVFSAADGTLIHQRSGLDDPSVINPRGLGLNYANARVVDLTPGASTRRPAVILRPAAGDPAAHALVFLDDPARPRDAWNFPVPANGWWMYALGTGDFDGDGALDVAGQLNGRAIQVHTGATDPMRLGQTLAGTTFVTDSVAQSIDRYVSWRPAGSNHDILYFFMPAGLGRIDGAAPGSISALTFRRRNAMGLGTGDQTLSVVRSPREPVLVAGGNGYLLVNLFDDHDCEQRTPDATATCSDLDGINDAATDHRWHLAVLDATDLHLVTERPGLVALATADLDGDGSPEILAQSAGSDYAVPAVTSVSALRFAPPMGTTPAALNTLWTVPNAGLAGVDLRDLQGNTSAAGAPVIIRGGNTRHLLLFQGDPSSTTTGVAVGLQFVSAADGVPFSRLAFGPNVRGRPIGLVRSLASVAEPDTLVVSENDGYFHLFTRDLRPPPDGVAAQGVVRSGGFLSQMASVHLNGPNARRADLVVNRSDQALVTVPTAGATPQRPPVETVRYYGGLWQFPTVIQSDDATPQPWVIVANRQSGNPYLAAINALAPTELWTSQPFMLPPGGVFMKTPLAVGDANADGVADVYVGYDGIVSTGLQTFATTQFYNAVSGRAPSGMGGRHPHLWTSPYSPELVGGSLCCADVAGGTLDLNGDNRSDLVIVQNGSISVRTGEDAAAMAQLLYVADSRAVTSPLSPMAMAPSRYGMPVVAPFLAGGGVAAIGGVGQFAGTTAALYPLTVTGQTMRQQSTAQFVMPEFSDGQVGAGAVASYANPAAHGATDPVGLGYGSVRGFFYALEPSAMTAGSTQVPLRWAACLHDGVSDLRAVVTQTTLDACQGRALSDAAAADIDGDGRDEFIVGSADGYLYALNAEDGTLAFAYNLRFRVGNPIVVDVDGDGSLGLFVSVGDGLVYALGASSPLALVSNAHFAAVQLGGAMPTVPQPDMAITRSESLEYLAAVWTDPSPMRDTVYRARLTTLNGSPVLPWTDVARGTPPTATVVNLLRAPLSLGLRYVVEVRAESPARAGQGADVHTIGPVEIADLTPPTIEPFRFEVTDAVARRARVRASLRDATALRQYTLRITAGDGSAVFTQQLPLTGMEATVDVPFAPAEVDAGMSRGPYTATLTVVDVGDHSAMAMATVDFDAMPPSDAGSVDAGSTEDAGRPLDGGGAAPAESGCGCRAPGRAPREGFAGLVLVLGALALRRRPRRSRD